MARSKSWIMASSIRPACWRTALALATRISDEIGLRFCGMVLDAPRWLANGSNTSPISVAIISMTSKPILPSEPVTRPRNCTVSTIASRATCQVIGRIAEAERAGILAPHVEALVAERGERAGGAAELRDQHARLQLAQPRGVAIQHGKPDGAFVAEGDRQRLLQMGTAGHRRVAMLRGEPGQRRRDGRHVALDQREPGAHLQHRRGVHDVLGGRAPVHVASGLAELRGKLPHQPDDRIADVLGVALERIAIERDRRRKPARSRRPPPAG